MTFIGVIITASILFGTLLINVKTLRLTRKDIVLRQRPWISSSPTRDNKAPILDMDNKTIKYYFKNVGPIPAFNLTRKYYISIKEPSAKIFDEGSSCVKVDNIKHDLGPNDEERVPIKLEEEEIFENLQNKKPVYFGIRLTYDDLDGKSHFYEYRGMFKGKEEIMEKINLD